MAAFHKPNLYAIFARSLDIGKQIVDNLVYVREYLFKCGVCTIPVTLI